MTVTMDLGFKSTSFETVKDVEIPDAYYNRFSTGLDCIDELFGGLGLMPGSTSLLGAAPGTGKTTLLLQLFQSIQNTSGRRCGYISGEESVQQLSFTAKRLNVKSVQVANMNDVDHITDAFPSFDVIAIDSFQCLSTKAVKGKTKIQQYAIVKIINAAKRTGTKVFVICHYTKDGKIKGDSTVIHAPDCVINLYKGDPEKYGSHSVRVIEVEKNRFGPIGELALSMTQTGYNFETPIEVING
jgi:DNA repair protein RadA/Sms